MIKINLDLESLLRALFVFIEHEYVWNIFSDIQSPFNNLVLLLGF